MNGLFLAAAILAVGQSDVELQASVRVNTNSPSSGTVIKIIDRTAYILSTGHMENRNTVKVEFFYMDGDKIKTPLTLEGHLVLLVDNHQKGMDFAVLKVELPPRIRPSYVPLADKKVRCRMGQDYLAIGCKTGKEPSEYTVTYLKEKDGSLITSKTEPLAGCSGGGIFRSGKLLGVCWGATTAVEHPEGMFTPHYRIITVLEAANLEFLTE